MWSSQLYHGAHVSDQILGSLAVTRHETLKFEYPDESMFCKPPWGSSA